MRTLSSALIIAVFALIATGVVYLVETALTLSIPSIKVPPSGGEANPQVMSGDEAKVVSNEILDVSHEEARTLNEKQPFAADQLVAAQPFDLPKSVTDIRNARDCLAAAQLYEAGNDNIGQRAVAQVVLNRVHHPAFPNTVCGVVFQGSERTTGCQFTFTCDGALSRRYSDAAWQRARAIALAALGGAVYGKVGLATHYHTDWVRPVWSGSLDKIAIVGSHLFYRWKGNWGTPRAFRSAYPGDEPMIAAMSVAPPDPLDLDPVLVGLIGAQNAAKLKPVNGDPNLFIIGLPGSLAPDKFPVLADLACGDRSICTVMGWPAGSAPPAALPLPAAFVASKAFSYDRAPSLAVAESRWDCARYRQIAPSACLTSVLLLEPTAKALIAAPVAPIETPAFTALNPSTQSKNTGREGQLGGVNRDAKPRPPAKTRPSGPTWTGS